MFVIFVIILTNFLFHVYSIIINWASRTSQNLVNDGERLLLKNNIYICNKISHHPDYTFN